MISMFIYESKLDSSCTHSWAHGSQHCTIDICVNCGSRKFSDTPWFKGVVRKNRDRADDMCPIQRTPPKFNQYTTTVDEYGRY